MGLAVGLAVLAPVNVADGVQVYVVAPLTVNVFELPLQIVYELATNEDGGKGVLCKVSVKGPLGAQPLAVPATV